MMIRSFVDAVQLPSVLIQLISHPKSIITSSYFLRTNVLTFIQGRTLIEKMTPYSVKKSHLFWSHS